MKKVFKKFVTMGLAAIMAVSAMSISAFADGEDTSNDVVISVLNENGIMQDYTQAEIDALGGFIEGYNGIIVTIMSDEEIQATLCRYKLSPRGFAALPDIGYDSIHIPIDGYTMRYNTKGYGYYDADFSIPKNTERFSNSLLCNLKSNVSMIIRPEQNLNNNLHAVFRQKTTIGFIPIFEFKVKDNSTGLRISSISDSEEYYVMLGNYNSFTAGGTVLLSTY